MITDRVWGCLVADPVVSAYNEAMFMALDHELNPYYVYGSEFQHQLDEKLAEMGALSIVDQGIIISEQAINQDLNENGQIDPLIVLLLFRYDDHSAAHNGFYGSLLNYYTYLVNRPKDRPTDEQIAYMQAYLTDQSLAPMVPVTAESGLSYDELVDTWREDLRALYREGEDKVYA